MRIRTPFAGAFAALVLISAYLGLAPRHYEWSELQYQGVKSDKILHFVTFFLLTLTFYWIAETSRRKVLQYTLLVCTAVLGVGSEILQGFLPNGRDFDLFDIVSNLLGSLSALGLCAWYHRRMLERKRAGKRFGSLGGDEESGGLGGGPGPEEMELEEGTGPQESGLVVTTTTTAAANGGVGAGKKTDLDAELDNWDENTEDWDAEEAEEEEESAKVMTAKSTIPRPGANGDVLAEDGVGSRGKGGGGVKEKSRAD